MLLLYAALGLSVWLLRSCLKRPRRLILAGAYVLLLIAGFMNGAVMLANHGHMPVRAPHAVLQASDSVHVPLDGNSRLPWLADVHGGYWVRYSLGDVFCALALLAFGVN